MHCASNGVVSKDLIDHHDWPASSATLNTQYSIENNMDAIEGVFFDAPGMIPGIDVSFVEFPEKQPPPFSPAITHCLHKMSDTRSYTCEQQFGWSLAA